MQYIRLYSTPFLYENNVSVAHIFMLISPTLPLAYLQLTLQTGELVPVQKKGVM